MKKLKRFKETSRGGRRQVILKNKSVRYVCERVSQEAGYPFQWCFDEIVEMFVEGHVFGISTQDKLFERISEKLEE